VSVDITNPDGNHVSDVFSVTAPLFSCEPDTVTYSYPPDKYRYFSGITVADLDGDGWLEIILVGVTEDPAGPGFVSVLANRHNRHFVEGTLKTLSGEEPRTVATGLFSGVLPLDIVVADTQGGKGPGRVQLLHPVSNNGGFDVTSGCSVHAPGLPW